MEAVLTYLHDCTFVCVRVYVCVRVCATVSSHVSLHILAGLSDSSSCMECADGGWRGGGVCLWTCPDSEPPSTVVCPQPPINLVLTGSKQRLRRMFILFVRDDEISPEIPYPGVGRDLIHFSH